ncbi:5'-AMP-activated protein kinase, regulatory beta subunit [Pelomyxa schiedti]|nr:5'-AMP-activated protein kinase, regulatory beta subunit [Pelomyxa schiedti]
MRVTITWTHGGHHVQLAGTFNSWSPQEASDHDVVGDPLFVLDLPAGKYQFKFVVDGAWFYDVRKPTVCDPDNNINNEIEVVEEAARDETVIPPVSNDTSNITPNLTSAPVTATEILSVEEDESSHTSLQTETSRTPNTELPSVEATIEPVNTEPIKAELAVQPEPPVQVAELPPQHENEPPTPTIVPAPAVESINVQTEPQQQKEVPPPVVTKESEEPKKLEKEVPIAVGTPNKPPTELRTSRSLDQLSSTDTSTPSQPHTQSTTVTASTPSPQKPASKGTGRLTKALSLSAISRLDVTVQQHPPPEPIPVAASFSRHLNIAAVRHPLAKNYTQFEQDLSCFFSATVTQYSVSDPQLVSSCSKGLCDAILIITCPTPMRKYMDLNDFESVIQDKFKGAAKKTKILDVLLLGKGVECETVGTAPVFRLRYDETGISVTNKAYNNPTALEKLFLACSTP